MESANIAKKKGGGETVAMESANIAKKKTGKKNRGNGVGKYRIEHRALAQILKSQHPSTFTI